VLHVLALSAPFASNAGTGVAMAIGGTVIVLVISAVFYVIGRGEDRDRAQAARDAQLRDAAASKPEPEPEPRPSARPPRLPASARHRRRR
jgi:hypothetical protein